MSSFETFRLLLELNFSFMQNSSSNDRPGHGSCFLRRAGLGHWFRMKLSLLLASLYQKVIKFFRTRKNADLQVVMFLQPALSSQTAASVPSRDQCNRLPSRAAAAAVPGLPTRAISRSYRSARDGTSFIQCLPPPLPSARRRDTGLWLGLRRLLIGEVPGMLL